MNKDVIEAIVQEHTHAMLHIATEYQGDRDRQISLMATQILESTEKLHRAGFY